ncbi:MAG: araR2 [Clostridiales bacterium]|jgi:GntR family transcriptional regulator of arabinose operon|nr:araR2 [Clostridiales bacterium]
MLHSEKPKYQQLKDYLIQTIKTQELHAGEKIPSENELAEKFEISRHTIRQAIGELVNEGWLYRVQGKGTYVNRPPDEKPRQSKTIGLITTYLNDYIFPSIIRGVYNVLHDKGFNIALSCTYNQHEKERTCLESLISQDLAGLIIEPTKSALPNPNIDLYKEFSRLGIPILFIHGSYRDLDYSYIIEDDMQAGYIATKHLIDQGHEKIAGVFKIDDVQGHYRFSGFQKAHIEAGLPISDSRILWFETDDMQIKFNAKGTYIQDILSHSTAVVCYNDQISLKVMDAIREKGLSIPEDISIVSFDDSQFAVASEIKLTTIAHPKEKLGEEAGKAIINMIERIQDYYDVKMQPQLIVRGSTKKWKSGGNMNE